MRSQMFAVNFLKRTLSNFSTLPFFLSLSSPSSTPVSLISFSPIYSPSVRLPYAQYGSMKINGAGRKGSFQKYRSPIFPRCVYAVFECTHFVNRPFSLQCCDLNIM